MRNPEKAAYSENIQMYLVEIRRYEKEQSPLPLPRLAEILGISVPSVNEMVKKLAEQGFLDYVPYAGVRLTDRGEDMAGRLLRKHRLWEVFLVDELGIDLEEAHDIACQLEHATPDGLAERLDVYLDHPRTNPQGEPIPAAGISRMELTARRLSECSAGDCGVVDTTGAEENEQAYLERLGIQPGVQVRVLAVDPDSLLIQAEEHTATLAREFAARIKVTMCREEEEASTPG